MDWELRAWRPCKDGTLLASVRRPELTRNAASVAVKGGFSYGPVMLVQAALGATLEPHEYAAESTNAMSTGPGHQTAVSSHLESSSERALAKAKIVTRSYRAGFGPTE